MDFDNIKDFVVRSDSQTIFSPNPGPPLGYWARLGAYSTSTTNATEAVFATASPYIKTFSVGNIINAAQNYTPTFASSPYFRAINWHMLLNMNNTYGGTTGTDIYIGFRKINGNDTIYGWMRMDNSTYSVTIKSYAVTVKNVGVKENMHFDSAINLFPNPVNSLMNLSVREQYVSGEIVIMDLFGREVLRKKVNKENTFDVEQLSSGIYFLSLVKKDKILVVQKFVKQ